MKQKIYVNFETITNSQEVIIDILNNKYNIIPPKTFEDLKDLTFKSIHREVSLDEIYKIKQSKEYYNNLKINSTFKELYLKTKDIYEWEIILEQQYQKYEYKVPIVLWVMQNVGDDIMIASIHQAIHKTNFDGTHIDFNYNNFNFNNSNNKILLTKLLDTKYNYLKGGEEHLYQVHTWNDISEIINFFNNKNI